MKFNVTYKHGRNGFAAGEVAVYNVEAETAAAAIAQAAKDLRLTPMDVGDPFSETANYSFILDAMPLETTI